MAFTDLHTIAEMFATLSVFDRGEPYSIVDQDEKNRRSAEYMADRRKDPTFRRAELARELERKRLQRQTPEGKAYLADYRRRRLAKLKEDPAAYESHLQRKRDREYRQRETARAGGPKQSHKLTPEQVSYAVSTTEHIVLVAQKLGIHPDSVRRLRREARTSSECAPQSKQSL